MSKKYSLLCPTRFRHTQRFKLIKSIIATTENIKDIELLFAIDKDDDQSEDHIKDAQKKYPELKIRVFKRNRSNFLNRDYYNWLSGFANGLYHWAIGDDVRFMMKGWDTYLQSRIEGYLKNKKDRIACVSVKDNTPKPSSTLPNFPCFPLVTREAIKALGFLVHPNVPTWGADYVLYRLYVGTNRLLEVQEHVILNHISWHTGQIEQDHINKRIGEIFNSLKNIPCYSTDEIVKTEVPVQIKYLNNVINGRIKL
jgi:hypothetical protein